MKRLLSVNYSDAVFNVAVLLLRLGSGLLLITNHGMYKLTHFSEMQNKFYNFMGLGSGVSLMLALFAETICSLFIILGLFTRIAALPLVITMCVVIFGANAGKAFGDSEMAILYLISFAFLLLCGPGKISVDAMINK
ncbi:MAG TPA: DoxX family protein [Chitinophagaceae bacterium]|nr:DoxX family protein [Chitinophagaceae bacterium]